MVENVPSTTVQEFVMEQQSNMLEKQNKKREFRCTYVSI